MKQINKERLEELKKFEHFLLWRMRYVVKDWKDDVRLNKVRTDNWHSWKITLQDRVKELEEWIAEQSCEERLVPKDKDCGECMPCKVRRK